MNNTQSLAKLLGLVVTTALMIPTIQISGRSSDHSIPAAAPHADAYTSLIRTLIAQNKIAEALTVAERSRTRAFVQHLSSRIPETAPQTVPANAGPIPPLDIAEIRNIARDTQATLVEYCLMGNQALYIWVVQPSGEIGFRSVEFNGVDDTGPTINPIAAIEDPVRRSEADTLQELHQSLIRPIADLLPADPEANVVFLPQGNLFWVPFAALQDEDGVYLIEKHTLLTAPSIQLFGLVSQSRQGTGDRGQGTGLREGEALVAGNPVMPRILTLTASGDVVETQLPDLPRAEVEAEAIGRLLGIPALIGDQATEARIKQQMPSAQLIHLATHGLLHYGDPRSLEALGVPGALALAAGDGEDGLLTSAEILGMRLQANLAVLSADDTGLGRITGDGVLGLSRALIVAGVPSVIVSLWTVSDAPTAELMIEFYRQLNQGQDKVQALRQAMLITKETHNHPRDWAAFTLIGAAD